MKPVGVAIVGTGYWGPNLFRNFLASETAELRWVCDLVGDRARKVVGRYSTVRVTESIEEVLSDPGVEAVALATPARTHGWLGMACLDAGKHLLVEKPLASSVTEGEKLVAAAADHGLVLMCDHTYCYTPAVRKLRELVASGVLGDIQYVLGDTFSPRAVAAHGADPIGAGRACVGYLALPLPGNAIAHVHINWLSPTKTRTMIIGGSKRVVVWDDLNPSQRLSMYDRGVDLGGNLENGQREAAVKEQLMISYRVGEMIAPALRETEALQGVVTEFTGAIRNGAVPVTDGEAGLRVLRVLEATTASLDREGALVSLDYR